MLKPAVPAAGIGAEPLAAQEDGRGSIPTGAQGSDSGASAAAEELACRHTAGADPADRNRGDGKKAADRALALCRDRRGARRASRSKPRQGTVQVKRIAADDTGGGHTVSATVFLVGGGAGQPGIRESRTQLDQPVEMGQY